MNDKEREKLERRQDIIIDIVMPICLAIMAIGTIGKIMITFFSHAH